LVERTIMDAIDGLAQQPIAVLRHCTCAVPVLAKRLPACAQMATLEKAEELLEQLRAASYTAAKQDLEDVRAFAAEQGCAEPLQQASRLGMRPGGGGVGGARPSGGGAERAVAGNFACAPLLTVVLVAVTLHARLYSSRSILMG
jgi:hypothetical protein